MRVLFAFLLGCTGNAAIDSSGDSAAVDEYCDTLDEGGRFSTAEGGATGASGLLAARVITSESEVARDPLYTAFKQYTIENVDSGGVQTTGETTGDGLVEEVLGAGTWALRVSYPRGSAACTAEIEVPIVAGSTTNACVVMDCP